MTVTEILSVALSFVDTLGLRPYIQAAVLVVIGIGLFKAVKNLND